ncbi:hypothetical protein Cni_G20393 [Canna indica]|uniref:Uncharacterized protein n=1 Tax=Canna indica TaxID=4628 RepID=A0AAQ3KNU7_9LILI|nr:hypothetical protein Cni_G20393 [Canna indica]
MRRRPPTPTLQGRLLLPHRRPRVLPEPKAPTYTPRLLPQTLTITGIRSHTARSDGAAADIALIVAPHCPPNARPVGNDL